MFYCEHDSNKMGGDLMTNQKVYHSVLSHKPNFNLAVGGAIVQIHYRKTKKQKQKTTILHSLH